MTTQNLIRRVFESLGYRVNERKFADKDIQLFLEKSGSVIPNDSDSRAVELAYFGAEHNGNPKLPNITVLPIYSPLASTFGHQHTQYEQGDTRRFQEIYEFLGYGGMLLRNSQGTTLHLLKPGEKVLAGTEDNMTIFNLQDEPLGTLDYANPEMNSADKNLEKRIGPLMKIENKRIIPSTDYHIIFKINDKYAEEKILDCDELPVPVCCIPSRRNMLPGKEIFTLLKDKSDYFERVCIKLSFGSNLPEDLRCKLRAPLLELALTKNETLLGELGIKQG